MKEYRVHGFYRFPDNQQLNELAREGWVFKAFHESPDTKETYGNPAKFTFLFERRISLRSIIKARFLLPLTRRFTAQKINVITWVNNLEVIKRRRQDKSLEKFRKM